jgi:hypothetical protein
MLIPLRYIVYFYWGLAFVLTLFAIPLIVRGAWKGTSAQLLEWRWAKVASASLGLIGFFLLALNFEQTVRSSLTDESHRYIQSLYLELKFIVIYDRAIACSKDQLDQNSQIACSDFSYLDQSLDLMSDLRGPFNEISPWRPNMAVGGGIIREHDIGTVLARVNNGLDNMERSRLGFELTPILNFEARFWIALVSLLLVLLAVATGLGESIYQLKLTLDQQRQNNATKATASKP